MEKFLVTPLKNAENGSGRTLVERNFSDTMKDKEEEIKIIEEKLTGKRITPIPVVCKNMKIKKLKMRRNRGEKRKFNDVTDSSKRIKKKKGEEKVSGHESKSKSVNSSEGCEKVVTGSGTGEISAVVHSVGESVMECRKLEKWKDFSGVENESDAENGERVIESSKPKQSRRRKVIATSCQGTLDVLLKFDLDVLNLLAKSFKIVKEYSLLSNKYISIDVLIDLISLALEKSRAPGDVDSEKELSLIISKCSKLFGAPKKSKLEQNTEQNIGTLSPECNALQEGSSAVGCSNSAGGGNEEILKDGKNKEDAMEEKSEMETITEHSEKSEETVVEKSGKNFCITNYFKKLKKNIEERDKNERFSCFTAKTDMFLAPKLGGELTGQRREQFERAFEAQDSESPYVAQILARTRSKKVPGAGVASDLPGGEERGGRGEDAGAPGRIGLCKVDGATSEHVEAVCRNKAKLLQFHDNRRPPYWGTWRRRSETVGPRRPLAREKALNYEIDSDDEWEEEEEAGESLRGSDEEKEPDEDYEVDNEFFVPHGYLSDDENPEKENLSPKSKLDLLEEQFTSEQKQKMRKMTPIVFGVFWMHLGRPSEGFLHQDLQIEKLQYVPWTSTPVEIEEEPEEPATVTKKPKQKIFPDEEIPDLIKMIHGSPQNCDRLARQFLLSRAAHASDAHRPGLTKICVQKKIRELAAWQAGMDKGKMCWHVPRETRLEFGTADQEKTPEKKPRECFIWKFVRRTEKSPETRNSPPLPPPPPMDPELLLLES